MRLDSITCTNLFDLCSTMDNASVDMILCDLPYGTTACSWDTVIPFEPMWQAFKRIIKPRGAIVLTASQPFTSLLVCSNLAWFRYEWIWRKNQATGVMNARYRPLKEHENVIVFSAAATRANQFQDQTCFYFPQDTIPSRTREKSKTKVTAINNLRGIKPGYYFRETSNFPKTVIDFDCESGLHPTQKPVALFEYLIRTYSQSGELVFDPCVGSGTTAIAARNTGRHWVCGDNDDGYVRIAVDRLQNTDPFQDRKVAPAVTQHSLFAAVI